MLSTLMMLTAMIIQSQSPLLTDDEWIAEGWEITNRETYAISDYVEPYAVTENGIVKYFVELCFTEEGEFRAGIKGDHKVVIIDEDLTSNFVEIPQLSEISISALNNFVYVLGNLYSTNNSVYERLIGAIEHMYTLDYPVIWVIDMEGSIAGVGGSTITFLDIDGNEIIRQDYPYRGLPTIANWAFARNGNLLITMESFDNQITAYDMSGNHLWDLHVDLRGGLMPLAVSDNGNTICITITLNGCIVVDKQGNIVMHVLGDNDYMQIESIDISPNGEYAAITAFQCIPRAETGKEQLYFVDIISESVSQIPLGSFSEVYSPQVMGISDDGYILSGLNHRDVTIHRGGIVERRVALLDNQGDYIWISDSTDLDDILVVLASQVQPLSSFIDALYGFEECIYSNNDVIRLAYVDLTTGNIVILSISEIDE